MNKKMFITRGFTFFIILSAYIVLVIAQAKAYFPLLALIIFICIMVFSGGLAWAFFGFLVEIKRVITHTEEIDSVKEQ